DGEAPPGATVTIKVSAGQSTVAEPNVDGAPEAAARSALEGVGLTNIANQPPAPGGIPAGNALTTNPGPGTEVTPDQTIARISSSGPDQVQVPGVQGLSEENARTMIESANLVMASNDEQISNPGQDGQVLTQSPGPGSQANPGDT